jgi:quinolinate synthase
MNNNSEWITAGYSTEAVSNKVDLVSEISRLKREKNAIIMAHYYQVKEIQDIADFVGDSLALAQQAAKTKADIILLAGVYFMGETAKILSPDKKVLVPDLNAGCSLADSCPADDFKKFKELYPDHVVVTYVNTTAAVKAISDIVVTSTNAVGVINSIPKDKAILFGPDKNLGNYLQGLSGREMVLWDGACHVHEKFSIEKIVQLKRENPDAKIIAHPECKKPLLILADFVGSTAALLKYTIENEANMFIVATEAGILHQMQKSSPSKMFIPAPPSDSTCGCNDCEFMKLNSLKKVYLALKNEFPEVHVDEKVRLEAVKPIERMLDISAKLKL